MQKLTPVDAGWPWMATVIVWTAEQKAPLCGGAFHLLQD
jgi:hypothetical protein